MPACVYCGGDAGKYDEHPECVEQAMAAALEAEDAELALRRELALELGD